MQNRNQFSNKLFIAISSLATMFVLTELILQTFFGKSICLTEGCTLTAQYSRFGDISILIIGLLTFFALTALAVLSRFYQVEGTERLLNLVLIVALAGEGFFMGFLAFRIHTLCVFCVIVFGFMVVLGMLRLLAGEKDLVAGFAALAAVFSMFYFILPAGVTVTLPENERLILFYGKECKHCAEIKKELEENTITVKYLEVTGYAAFLKSMGIEHVPTLYVNDKYQKAFFTGKDAIRRYLITCTESAKKAEKLKQQTKKKKASNPRKADDAGLMIDIFHQQSLIPQNGQPAPDDGMCKEDEPCK